MREHLVTTGKIARGRPRLGVNSNGEDVRARLVHEVDIDTVPPSRCALFDSVLEGLYILNCLNISSRLLLREQT